MSQFTVKRIRFRNGERTSVLLRPDGVPVHEVVLFLDRYRRRGRAANTLHAICCALAVLYREMARSEIDLVARLREGRFLTSTELNRVAAATQFRADDSSAAEDPASSPNVINLRSVQPRIRAKSVEVVAVDPTTQRTRMAYIGEFLVYLADYVASELEEAAGNRLLMAAKREVTAFKAQAPRKRGRARVGARQGLSVEEQDRLLDTVRPGSAANPWVRPYVQQRNFVIVALLLATGMRRGELLGLQVKDIESPKPNLRILRRADSPDDQRTTQPNTKTNDRVVELHQSIARRLWGYINNERNAIAAARRCPQIFVADDGNPMSLASIDKIFKDIRLACPGLSVRLTSHVMRHTWNERFSEEADRLELSDVSEERARNAQQGWSDDSQSARTYTRRHAAEVGRRLSLKHQERLSESLDKN